MNIGVDVDGVLTNLESYINEYGIKYAYENNFNLENYDANKSNTKLRFSWSEEEDEKFWVSILEEYSKKEKPRDFASEVIEKLRKKGHKIYIITSRYSMIEKDIKSKKIEKLLLKWLRKHKIKYDSIIFVQNKIESVINNKIDIMIEDSPENIEMLKTYTKMVVFHSTYNEMVSDKDAKRVYGWYQVLDYIEKIENTL